MLLLALSPKSTPVLPILEELWLPEELSDREWDILATLIERRDEVGCRGLRRLDGDWARAPRGETEEEVESFYQKFGRLYNILGKTLEVLGGKGMYDLDDDSLQVWADVFMNPSTPTHALQELSVTNVGDFSTWAKALDEGGPNVTPNLLLLNGVQMYGDWQQQAQARGLAEAATGRPVRRRSGSRSDRRGHRHAGEPAPLHLSPSADARMQSLWVARCLGVGRYA